MIQRANSMQVNLIMEITDGTFTKSDGSSHRQIQISDDDDWKLFEYVAGVLEMSLQGHWTQRLDGTDQRFWDLGVRSGRLTLHLEHYLGIMLYPTAGADANSESLALMEKAYSLLSRHEPV